MAFRYPLPYVRPSRTGPGCNAKVTRQRQDFLYQTSAMLIKRFGALRTESLAVQNMLKRGGIRKKGLNRERHAVPPAAFLKGVERWKLPSDEARNSRRSHLGLGGGSS